jgi:hypothetical protein
MPVEETKEKPKLTKNWSCMSTIWFFFCSNAQITETTSRFVRLFKTPKKYLTSYYCIDSWIL